MNLQGYCNICWQLQGFCRQEYSLLIVRTLQLQIDKELIQLLDCHNIYWSVDFLQEHIDYSHIRFFNYLNLHRLHPQFLDGDSFSMSTYHNHVSSIRCRHHHRHRRLYLCRSDWSNSWNSTYQSHNNVHSYNLSSDYYYRRNHRNLRSFSMSDMKYDRFSCY